MNVRSSRSGARRRRRRDTEPVQRRLAKGLVVVGLLAAVGWLAVSLYSGVPGRDYEHVVASVPQIGNLIAHDPVRIAGVRVGQVEDVQRGADGRTRVKLQLEPGTKLPSDTGVQVRANGLLGARYVELTPGTSTTMLASGATIRGDRRSLTFGIPEALDTFDAPTRRALGDTIGELGKGLLGHGSQLNDAVRLTAPQLEPFQRLVTEVLARPGAARRLVPSLGSAAHVLQASRGDLAALPGQAAAAFEPLAQQPRELRQTIELAPSAERAARDGLEAGRELLSATRLLAVQATRTLPAAAGGLRAATTLLHDARHPLRRTAPLLRAVTPTVPAVLRVTRALSPVLGPLGGALGDLGPMLDDIGPYGCDLITFGYNMRSMTGAGGTGTGPNRQPSHFRLQALAGTEVLGTNLQGFVKRDGYAPPCKYRPSSYPSIDPRGAVR